MYGPKIQVVSRQWPEGGVRREGEARGWGEKARGNKPFDASHAIRCHLSMISAAIRAEFERLVMFAQHFATRYRLTNNFSAYLKTPIGRKQIFIRKTRRWPGYHVKDRLAHYGPICQSTESMRRDRSYRDKTLPMKMAATVNLKRVAT